MTRREAREQALSMIFEMNFNDNSVDEMVDNALIFRDESVDEYAVQIAQQVRFALGGQPFRCGAVQQKVESKPSAQGFAGHSYAGHH